MLGAAPHLHLEGLSAHADVHVDKDHPALLCLISKDEGSTVLTEVNPSRGLLRHRIAHLRTHTVTGEITIHLSHLIMYHIKLIHFLSLHGRQRACVPCIRLCNGHVHCTAEVTQDARTHARVYTITRSLCVLACVYECALSLCLPC